MPLNNSNPLEMFNYANALSEFWLAHGLLIALFIISMMIFWRFPKPHALAAAAFITFLATVFLYTMGQVIVTAVIISIVLIGVAAVAVYLSAE